MQRTPRGIIGRRGLHVQNVVQVNAETNNHKVKARLRRDFFDSLGRSLETGVAGTTDNSAYILLCNINKSERLLLHHGQQLKMFIPMHKFQQLQTGIRVRARFVEREVVINSIHLVLDHISKIPHRAVVKISWL